MTASLTSAHAALGAGSSALWIALIIAVLATVDLLLVYRRPESLTVFRAAGWTALWTAGGFLFGGGLYAASDSESGQSFFVGFLFEKLLFVGNVFLIARVVSASGWRGDHEQHLVFWSSVGAWLIRGPVIATSVALVHLSPLVVYFFGVVSFAAGALLIVTRRGHGPALSSRSSSILAVLAVVALVNLAFAAAACPTIHAFTDDALVIWTSNGLALLGFGPLYFLMSRPLLQRFHLLEFALASLLFIVGTKLLLSSLWPMSLGFAASASLSAVGMFAAASLARPEGMRNVY